MPRGDPRRPVVSVMVKQDRRWRACWGKCAEINRRAGPGSLAIQQRQAFPANGAIDMAMGQRSDVLHHLRRATLLRDGGGMTYGQLLECFLSHRDEVAFEALVQRHGPLVWGVCRRTLRNYHDAEDAFQATF